MFASLGKLAANERISEGVARKMAFECDKLKCCSNCDEAVCSDERLTL